MRSTWKLLLLVSAIAAMTQPLYGQTSFGNRSLGGTLTAGSRSAFGTGGAGGGAGGGALGGGTGSTLDQVANTGTITGSERYVRDNRSVGQFVGSDTTESSFVGAYSQNSTGGTLGMGGRGGTLGGMGMGSTGLGGRGGTSMLGMGGGLGTSGLGMSGLGSTGLGRGGLGTTGGFGQQGFGRAGQGGFGANSNRQVNVRTQIRVGFRYDPINQTDVHTRLTGRLNSDRIQSLGEIRVDLTDRVATLTGVVATEEDRQLAVRVAKLEAGVTEVRDELTVAPEEDPARLSPSDNPLP